MPTPISDVVQHLCKAICRQDVAGLTDGQLLGRFVEHRDEAAVAALVQRHSSMVWGVCRRILPNHHDTEDAFQATFLVLVRRATSITPREMVGNWLYGVAHQTAMKARANAAKRRTRETQVTAVPEAQAPEQDAWRDLQPVLDQELSRLPDKYRAAIVLCDLEGKTRKEAARQLGLPEGTVAGRLTTGRALLAKRLARYGLALSGGALAAVLSQNAASAAVPTSVVSSTIKAVLLVAAGQAAATGVISVQVAALTEGVIRAMFVTKLKIATAVLLMATVVGAAWLLQQPTVAQPAAGADAKRTETAPADEEVRSAGEPRVLKLDGGGRRVAWSPDGKTLAVAEINEPLFGIDLFGKKESALKLWDVDKGQVRQTLAESTIGGLAFQQVVFSADGKMIAATVSEANRDSVMNVVKVWDAKTSDLKYTLTSGGDSQLVCVAWSPDGKLVAAGDPSKKTILLSHAGTGALERTLQTGEVQPWSLAFSPDSKALIVGGQKATGSGVIGLWDAGTGKVKHTLEREKYVMLQPRTVFSANGKMFLAGGAAGEGVLWDVENGKRIGSLQGLERITRSVAFSPDSKTVATAGREGKVRLWDVETGKLQKILEGHDSEIYSLAFSPDGTTLASVSQDGTVRLWRMGKRGSEKK